MELIIYYILPNIALFGGIFLLSKLIENVVWYMICNHEDILKGN
jgi:hypothetical protein